MERRIGEAVIVASPHNLPGSRRQLALGGRSRWMERVFPLRVVMKYEHCRPRTAPNPRYPALECPDVQWP